ncbi:MAG: YdbL family protein [Pseudomonadota bacterium]
MPLFRLLVIAAILAIAGLIAAPNAHAGDPQIDAAKAQGVVGERIDGYLGVIGSADASVRRKVDEINNRRRAVYSDLAEQTGTTVAQVARVTGEKQIAGAVRGEMIMDESGSWKKK